MYDLLESRLGQRDSGVASKPTHTQHRFGQSGQCEPSWKDYGENSPFVTKYADRPTVRFSDVRGPLSLLSRGRVSAYRARDPCIDPSSPVIIAADAEVICCTILLEPFHG
jgi:hypothetical protein